MKNHYYRAVLLKHVGGTGYGFVEYLVRAADPAAVETQLNLPHPDVLAYRIRELEGGLDVPLLLDVTPVDGHTAETWAETRGGDWAAQGAAWTEHTAVST